MADIDGLVGTAGARFDNNNKHFLIFWTLFDINQSLDRQLN